MARTFISIDLDDAVWQMVETAAQAEDVSPEVWISFHLEQWINRDRHVKRSPTSPPQPADVPVSDPTEDSRASE